MDNLKLIVFENCREFGEKVDKNLRELTGSKESHIIPIKEVRFNNVEGKVVIEQTINSICIGIFAAWFPLAVIWIE